MKKKLSFEEWSNAVKLLYGTEGKVSIDSGKPYFHDIHFSKIDFNKVVFPENVTLCGCTLDVPVKNYSLRNIEFRDCRFDKMTFTNCDLTGSKFVIDALRHGSISFDGSDLMGVEFDCNIENLDRWYRGHCIDFNFSNTKNFNTVSGISGYFVDIGDFVDSERFNTMNPDEFANVGPFVVKWSGWRAYYLNNVKINKSLYDFLTIPADTITLSDIKKVMKRNDSFIISIIEKAGIQKVLGAVGKVIEKKDGYVLHQLDANRERMLYLEMTNPSTGERHFEGIAPTQEVKFIDQALIFRNGVPGRPEILT